MKSTAQRVVLVTAAARGIGLATARAFAAQGDRVHVAWRSTSSAQQALASEFGAACVHRADLVIEADARRLVAEVIAADGRLDVLVHPVGEFVTGSLEAARADGLAHMIQSNVTTSFHVFDAARP